MNNRWEQRKEMERMRNQRRVIMFRKKGGKDAHIMVHYVINIQLVYTTCSSGNKLNVVVRGEQCTVGLSYIRVRHLLLVCPGVDDNRGERERVESRVRSFSWSCHKKSLKILPLLTSL